MPIELNANTLTIAVVVVAVGLLVVWAVARFVLAMTHALLHLIWIAALLLAGLWGIRTLTDYDPFEKVIEFLEPHVPGNVHETTKPAPEPSEVPEQ